MSRPRRAAARQLAQEQALHYSAASLLAKLVLLTRISSVRNGDLERSQIAQPDLKAMRNFQKKLDRAVKEFERDLEE